MLEERAARETRALSAVRRELDDLREHSAVARERFEEEVRDAALQAAEKAYSLNLERSRSGESEKEAEVRAAATTQREEEAEEAGELLQLAQKEVEALRAKHAADEQTLAVMDANLRESAENSARIMKSVCCCLFSPMFIFKQWLIGRLISWLAGWLNSCLAVSHFLQRPVCPWSC